MKFSLPSFAIHRPVTMTMLVITLLGLGAIALHLIPLEFIPRVDVPILTCYIPYPGAAPRQVEKEVAIPAEGEFMTLSGLERITSSCNSGGCHIAMNFDWDANMALATTELRDRIERLKLALPDEIDRVFIRRYYSDRAPIMRFALFREENGDELAHAARTMLKNRLMRVKGVADVEISGREIEEVYVEFDQEQLLSRNLGIYEAVSALQQSSVNVSIGELKDGATKYLVRTQGEYTHPDELKDLILSAGGVRLGDVATVSVRPPSGTGRFSIDGKPGIFIRVRREAEANTVETCDAVHEELARIQEEPAFKDAEIFIFDDQGEIVRFAIGALLKAGKFGSLLAFLVLLFSLRRLGPTLVVALMTPASLVAAIVYLYLSGHSLNLVTMSAMLVAVGMLVDNAIVVIENIQRHNHLSTDWQKNAQRGASEVGLAITAATLTTIVVFIPVIYLEAGELSLFMREFSGPMTIALLASLVLALTVLPLAESRLQGFSTKNHWRLFRNKKRTKKSKKRRFSFQPIENSRILYTDLLNKILDRRSISIGALALLLLITYHVPFKSVGMQQMPSLDIRQVNIDFRTEANYGYDRTKTDTNKLLSLLDDKRQELGIKNIFLEQWSTGANIRLFLLQKDELPSGEILPYSTKEVQQIVAELLPQKLPGASITCGANAASSSTQSQVVSVRMRGDDMQTLESFAEEFRRRMSSHPDLYETRTSKDESRKEIQIHIDKAKAASHGISPMVIARTVSFSLRGTRLPFMKRNGREITVWSRFQGEDRRSKADLENVAFQEFGGELIKLKQLVNMTQAPAPSGAYRENGKNVLTISGQTQEKNLSPIQNDLTAMAATMELPQGYSLHLGDRLKTLDKNLQNFQNTLIMSVLLIYIVMAALFESLLLPLSILTSVLLAFVGVYWSMYLTNTPMDTIALIGSILMCGIIVNNGIVIVDHINQLRRQGVPRTKAILQAGKDRFRPVIMTSLTTILGTIPLAIGGSDTSSALASLGRAFVGGLSAGTLLTLLVVPLIYTLIDDLQQWSKNFLASLIKLHPTSR